MVGRRSSGAKNRKSPVGRLFDGANVLVMILLGAVMVYPFLYTANVSISAGEKVLAGGAFLLPENPTLIAYKTVLSSSSLWVAYKNTILVTLLGTIAKVFFTGLTAYVLSKRSLPLNGLFTFLVVFTMLFQGGLIPKFLVVKGIGLYNSRLALVLPGLIGAFSVVIMRNFFQGIPSEIEDCAQIEGASPLVIFFRIIIPLSMPVVATISLWYAVGIWNDFFQCLVFIRDRSKMVVQLLLREIVMLSNIDEYTEMHTQGIVIEETVKAAAVMIVTLPILAVYPFLQKYFVKGAIMGSLKG